MEIPFSLLISTYWKDNPFQIKEAFESIVANSLLPQEVVIVFDGEIPEENKRVICSFKSKVSIKIVPLKLNMGLGAALAEGLKFCSYDWIARFDTDDICMPERFAKQIEFVKKNPDVDVFGSSVLEFSDDILENKFFLKKVPCGRDEIVQYSKKRNPLNHMSVMFKKSSVMAVGGYKNDLYFEDYSLWVRLILNGYVIENMSEPTVWVRAGTDMFSRRGGWSYIRCEFNAQYKFFRWGFLSILEFVRNLAVRIPLRLLPSNLRKNIYEKKLRENSEQ